MTLQRLPKQDHVACSGSSGDPRAARKRAIGSRNHVEAPLAYHAIIAAPFGCVGVRTDGQCVTTVTYLPPDTPLRPAFDALARETCAQIAAYLRDPKHRFDLPYATKGSMFELGTPVVIEDGPLEGVRAISLGLDARQLLIVAVTLRRQTMAVKLDPAWVRIECPERPVPAPAAH